MVRITLTKHAEMKLKERGLPLKAVRKVVEDPKLRFYDVVNNTEVSIGDVKIHGTRVSLAVVFIRRGERVRIVTAYPCKKMMEEAERKEKLGRWVRLVARNEGLVR